MEQSRRLSMQLTEAMLQWNKKPSLASKPIRGVQVGDKGDEGNGVDDKDSTTTNNNNINDERSFAFEDCDYVLNISRAVAATGTAILYTLLLCATTMRLHKFS